MGLDVYAARSPDRRLTFWDRRAFKTADVRLAGGMHSGAPGSFRGKLYDDLVRHVTGVSLYQKWIPPETVRLMAESLVGCDPADAEEYAESDLLQLRAFFDVCARRKLGLVGWW